MSVVFKEKHYDQILIIVNNLLIILLLMVILTTAFNLNIKSRVANLTKDLKLYKEEGLKYNSLMRNLNGNQSGKEIKYNNYNFLISLADYADRIIYNSLDFKNSKINLKAVSSQQKNIFALVEALEKDDKFSQVKLININQKESYFFELETLIKQ